MSDIAHALRGRLAHDDLSVYNAAQRAAYLALILALVVLILSGLAIWKPVQLQELAALMGGYEGARLLHFFAMSLVVLIVAGARRHGRARAAHLPHHDHRAYSGGPHEEQPQSDRSPSQVKKLERRLFLKQSLSIGALSLSGRLRDHRATSASRRCSTAMSRWNDRVQGWLFDPKQLAPEFPESVITRPFPFNAYYAERRGAHRRRDRLQVQLGGLIKEQKPWRCRSSTRCRRYRR